MNIMITGASRGLGAALAKMAGKNSDHRVFMVSRNEKALNEVKKQIITDNKNSNIEIFPVDLSEEENVLDFIEKMTRITDKLDVLINNAGLLINKSFQDLDGDAIQKMFRINYIAPSLLISGLIPLLRQSEVAHVVNIGSMGGYQGSVKFPGLSHYSAGKAALSVLTECLAEEFKKEKMSFNCLAIGSVQTEMLEEAFPGMKAPLQAEELAEFIYDFALRAYRYVNGKIIPLSLSTP